RPVREGEPLTGSVGHLGGHPDEHDVRLDLLDDLEARDTALLGHLGEAGREAAGHRIGPFGRSAPQIAFVQSVQLGREETHLRGQLQVHLAQKAHALADVGIEDDDGLGAEQAVLRPAEADDVDADGGGDVAESDAEVGGGVPQSLDSERLTASGGALCSCPRPMIAPLMVSGVSLPFSVAAPTILSPPTFSGAPVSSLLMCAEAAVITAAHRGRADWRARTFAPVPLKTGNAWASGPKWRVMISWTRAVHASPPSP